MVKQFRRLRRGFRRFLGALCLVRKPRRSEEDPEKPEKLVYIHNLHNVPPAPKLSIDDAPVDHGPAYPRHFPLLQLPVELQLEVIDRIYDLSRVDDDSAEVTLLVNLDPNPLLNLRLYVPTLFTHST